MTYPLVRVRFHAYNQPLLNAFTRFAQTVARDAFKLEGTSAITGQPAEVKRWTVLRSPHVNKTAREQFEQRTHRQQIQIAEKEAESAGNEAARAEIWVDYLRESCPAGVGMKVSYWDRIRVRESPELAYKQQQQ